MKFKFNGNLDNGGSIYGYQHEKGIVDIPDDNEKVINKLKNNSHFEEIKKRKPAASKHVGIKKAE